MAGYHIFVLPVLDYIHHDTRIASQGVFTRNYGAHWWLGREKIAGFYIGPMRMSGYLDMTQHFYQRYMWFLFLLLLFFVAFWLFYQAREK